MIEFLRQFITGVGEAWKRLSLNARAQIVLAGLLSIVLLAVAVFFGSQPDYLNLYTRLDLDESNEMAAWLTDNEIPYLLRDGGQTIQVPSRDVQRSRVGLVGLGLPRTQGVSEGFEMFSNRDLMTNEWLQNVDFMRATQGEAQRQLNQMDFVRKSSVLISESKNELFASDQKPSEASVVLDTTRQLTKREVKAILNIVGSLGGAHLSPKNITVTLTNGTLLHSPIEDEFASLASDQLEARVDFESERERKIRTSLEQIGLQVVVNVSATFDWSSELKSVRDVTEGQPVASETTSTISTTTEGAAEGPAGATAQIPDLGQTGAQTMSNEQETSVENFELGESLTTTRREPGQVTLLRVAAFIGGTWEDSEDGEAPTYVPKTRAELDIYKEFIENSVSFDEVATVSVYDHPFPDARELDRIVAAQVLPVSGLSGILQNSTVRMAINVVMMALVFILLRVFMRRAMVLPTVEEEETVELPEATREDLRRMEVASEVERLSREEPEAVAALLRSWMSQED